MDLTSSPSEESLKLKRALPSYLLLCACFVILSGYHFCDDGRNFFGDSSIHVPFIMLKWNPNMFQGDLVREGQKGFVTLFFSLYGKLTHNITQLEAAYFVSFCLFNFLIMVSLSRLFFLLCRDETASFLSVACIYFGFVPVLGGNFPYNEMVHSTAAFPFVIAALYCFFKKQFVACGILLGLATDFHGIYALFVFIAVWFYFILDFSTFRKKLREIFLFTACYAFFSLPIFIMKSGQVESPVPLQQWMAVLSVRAPHHFFPQLWDKDTYIRFFIFTGLFLLSIAQTETLKNLRFWKKELTALFLMVVFMIFTGTFFVLIIPVRFAIELTGFRATLFFVLCAYPFIASSLLRQMKNGGNSPALSAAFMACALLSNYYTNLLLLGFLCVLVSVIFEKRFAFLKSVLLPVLLSAFLLMLARHVFIYLWKGNFPSSLYFCLLPQSTEAFKITKLALFLSAALFALSTRRAPAHAESRYSFPSFFLAACLAVSAYKIAFMGMPSFYVRATGAYMQVQNFVRKNTPQDALILVPPYLTSFRTYYERGIYTDFKSGTYSSYNPLYAVRWWERIQALGIRHYNDDMKRIYNSLPQNKMQALSEKYHIGYFVTESKKNYPFSVMFKNETFAVYKLPLRGTP